MNTIEQVAHNATVAALSVVDLMTEGETTVSAGPCGDKLAFSIEQLITTALSEHFNGRKD